MLPLEESKKVRNFLRHQYSCPRIDAMQHCGHLLTSSVQLSADRCDVTLWATIDAIIQLSADRCDVTRGQLLKSSVQLSADRCGVTLWATSDAISTAVRGQTRCSTRPKEHFCVVRTATSSLHLFCSCLTQKYSC